MSEMKSMGEYLALPEAEKIRMATLPPVRSAALLAALRLALDIIQRPEVRPYVSPDERDTIRDAIAPAGAGKNWPPDCPHCCNRLLTSEDRGLHCDGCDDLTAEDEEIIMVKFTLNTAPAGAGKKEGGR